MYSPRIGCLSVHSVPLSNTGCQIWRLFQCPTNPLRVLLGAIWWSHYYIWWSLTPKHRAAPNPSTSTLPDHMKIVKPCHMKIFKVWSDSIFNAEHFERGLRLSRQFLRTNGVNNWMVTPHTVLDTTYSAWQSTQCLTPDTVLDTEHSAQLTQN